MFIKTYSWTDLNGTLIMVISLTINFPVEGLKSLQKKRVTDRWASPSIAGSLLEAGWGFRKAKKQRSKTKNSPFDNTGGENTPCIHVYSVLHSVLRFNLTLTPVSYFTVVEWLRWRARNPLGPLCAVSNPANKVGCWLRLFVWNWVEVFLQRCFILSSDGFI